MNRNRGMTLIEIMIALLLGLMVIGGVMTIYISSIRGSTDIANSARLNYDLDSVMQMMVNDIRRAGYWGDAVSGSVAKNNPPTCDTGNPFTCGDADIVISKKTGEADDSCILYAYDFDDGDSTTTPEEPDGNVNLNEYFGFRLNGNGVDMRYSVDDATNISCDDGNWENIVDTETVSINSLSFSMVNSKCLNNTISDVYTDTSNPIDNSCAAAVSEGAVSSDDVVIETRQIDITLTGQVNGEDVVNKSLTDIVKVRNDRIFEQP